MKQTTILRTAAYALPLAISFATYAQPNPEWVQRYNGPANRGDNARIIAIGPGNTIYVTGSSDGKKGSDWDITTVRYNASGVQQYAVRYNGPGNGDDYPFGMTVDAAGNAYVTGRSMGSNGKLDIVTIKYDPAGTQLWAERFNGPMNLHDFGRDVKVDALGNVFVAGVIDGANTFNGNAIILIKYDAGGALQWSQVYNNLPDIFDGSGTSKEEVNSIALDNAGNIYLAGKSAGFLTLKYNAAGQLQWSSDLGGSDARKIKIDAFGDIVVAGWGSRVAKYDASGNLLWTHLHSGTYSQVTFQDLELDASGNVYLAGYASNGGTQDIFAAKYAADGTFQWDAGYAGTAGQSDFGRGLALDDAGNAYVCGWAMYTSGKGTTQNFVTLKYSSSGAQQWIARYQAANAAFDIAIDNLGNLYVTGEGATKTSYIDYVTLKYSQASLRTMPPASIVTTLSAAAFRAYPNPASAQATLEYTISEAGRTRITISDLAGREVGVVADRHTDAGTHQVPLSTHGLSPGVYFCRLQSGKTDMRVKLVVMH